jgi:hypothetical protein
MTQDSPVTSITAMHQKIAETGVGGAPYGASEVIV